MPSLHKNNHVEIIDKAADQDFWDAGHIFIPSRLPTKALPQTSHDTGEEKNKSYLL